MSERALPPSLPCRVAPPATGAVLGKQGALLAVMALSSLMSIGLTAARIAYAETIVYSFLIWNLFLAWVPLVAAWALWQLDQRARRRWSLLVTLLAVWLLFFPNAPYIVTDLMHLGHRPIVPIWYDAILLFTFAWNGLLLGLLSLWIVHELVASWLGVWMGWLWVSFALLASGFGVYLGRFGRWNSWDVLANPQGLVQDMIGPLLNPMAHPRTVAVTLLFAAFLGVAYLTLRVLVSSSRLIDEDRDEGARTPVFNT